MRALQVIFTVIFAAVAIIGGFVAALVVGTVGLAIVLVRRLLGRPPALQRRTPGQRAGHAPGDVIDVTATDVTPEDPAANRIAR